MVCGMCRRLHLYKKLGCFAYFVCRTLLWLQKINKEPVGARFFFVKLAARALDILASVRLDYFHATDFGGSEHSEEKVYEVYILFQLCLSAVSIGFEAASYKQLVQVSLIFSTFLKAFWSYYWCI